MKTFHTVVLALVGSFSISAFAFDPDIAAIEDQTVINRFPAGSIVTSKMDELADYSTRRCGENFLVNHCIEQVRKATMRQNRKFLAIETEARKFVRQDEARIEREKQAERDRKAAQPPNRIEPAKGRPANAAQESAAKNRQARKQRIIEVEERQAAALQKASQEEVKRAKHEEKLKQQEVRRKQREAKLKARAAERAKKAKQAQK